VPSRPYAPRARRYVVPISVLYRAQGEKTSLHGRTENISKSGVLVRADRLMKVRTPVELLLTIPPDLPSPFSGTTICRGRIVRAVEPSPLEDRPAFAARIVEYETSPSIDPGRI